MSTVSCTPGSERMQRRYALSAL